MAELARRPAWPTGGVRRARQPAPLHLRVLAAVAAASAPAFLLALVVLRSGLSSPLTLPLLAVTGLVNLGVVLLDLRYGLVLFIVAAGISPKLPGLYNNLRIEDFVFALVFGVWLAKALWCGRVPLVRSPIVLPFLWLTVASLLSTLWGAYLGRLLDHTYAVLLQAKRIEYFLIFWVVATTVRERSWLQLMTILVVISGSLAALYGWVTAGQGEFGQEGARVLGPAGENYNTLSGYLVLCACLSLALLPAVESRRLRVCLLCCGALAALGVLLSFSREGYVVLLGALLVFGFTRQRMVLLVAVVGLAAAMIFVPAVQQNATDTVAKIGSAQNDDVGGNSLTARLRGWEAALTYRFAEQPLVGMGVGSVPLSLDGEYIIRACEVGALGLVFFAWLLAGIWRQIARLHTAERFARALGVGLTAGFVGLLIQGFVAASFSTIRTMEPFWFLLGLAHPTALLCAAPSLSRRTVPRGYPWRSPVRAVVQRAATEV
jgi:hypothetical protein